MKCLCLQNFRSFSFDCIKFVHELGKGKASKKPKPEPTRDDMHAVIVDILKEVDFNTVSFIIAT